MTCKCGSMRLMSVNGKCSDLGSVRVEHLNIDHDGYMPDIKGVCSGDYVEFTVCLDCGLLQGFETLSDEDLKIALDIESDDADGEGDEDDDEGPQYPTLDETMSGDKWPRPEYVRYTHNKREYELHYSGIMFHRDKAVMLLEDAFGKGWRGNGEARDILHNSVKAPPSIDIGAAAYMILKEIE